LGKRQTPQCSSISPLDALALLAVRSIWPHVADSSSSTLWQAVVLKRKRKKQKAVTTKFAEIYNAHNHGDAVCELPADGRFIALRSAVTG
jgi:hypothetical protein